MSFEARLAELGITLPRTHSPIANYEAVAIVGDIAYVSGHGPQREDGTFGFIGKVGDAVTVEQAYEAARLTILNSLASLREAIGSLDRVSRIVKLLGMVNSAPSFDRQPAVINGASDLLVEIFGDAGKHARSAVGMGALPMGISVEIEVIARIAPE